jgi:succinyl-CoA synthetase beta subunit
MKRNHYLILGGIALIGGYLWYKNDKDKKARKALATSLTPITQGEASNFVGEMELAELKRQQALAMAQSQSKGKGRSKGGLLSLAELERQAMAETQNQIALATAQSQSKRRSNFYRP